MPKHEVIKLASSTLSVDRFTFKRVCKALNAQPTSLRQVLKNCVEHGGPLAPSLVEQLMQIERDPAAFGIVPDARYEEAKAIVRTYPSMQKAAQWMGLVYHQLYQFMHGGQLKNRERLTNHILREGSCYGHEHPPVARSPEYEALVTQLKAFRTKAEAARTLGVDYQDVHRVMLGTAGAKTTSKVLSALQALDKDLVPRASTEAEREELYQIQNKLRLSTASYNLMASLWGISVHRLKKFMLLRDPRDDVGLVDEVRRKSDGG